MKKLFFSIALLLLALDAMAQIPVPKARWTLNQNHNDTIGNLDGVPNGGSWTLDRNANSNAAYLFDGSNDRIKLTNSKDSLAFINNTGVFSISLFAKINNLNVNNTILSSTGSSAERGFYFAWDVYPSYGNDALRLTMFDPTGNAYNAYGAQNSISDNNWHHIALVGNGTSIKFYVDGVQDGSTSSGGATGPGLPVSDAFIGTYLIAGNPSGNYFNGAMDDIMIFDVALSATDIQALAAGAEPGSPAQGSSLWTLNTPSSDIYYDQGKVSIGSDYSHNDYALAVKGKVLAEQVKVQSFGSWPDYVFSHDYELPSLSDIEVYISRNKHLPQVPSAKDIKSNGLDLGEMDKTLLKKVEELTLYTIAQDKQLKAQEKLIQQLLTRLEKLEKQ